VSPDVLLLTAAGLIAILAGCLLAFQRPRYASLIAAASLASLGVLQFGWARAIYDTSAAGRGAWFELSLALALPVSLSWLILSLTLLRGPDLALSAGWRVYIVAQAAGSVAALAFVALVPAGQTLRLSHAEDVFPLRPAGAAMIGGILINLILLTANFESTYISLPRRVRAAFRPGIAGILLCAGFFAYMSAGSLLGGHIGVQDIGLGALAVAGIAFLLPMSLLPGRVIEMHVPSARRPTMSTTSFGITIGFLASVSALAWTVRLTGWSLARALWSFAVVGGATGIAALAVSNRLQRRAQRLVEPFIHRGAVDRDEIAGRATNAISQARSLGELFRIIPSSVRELIGADPVTLFVPDERDARFVVAASTLDPEPSVSFGADDPLATELRRTMHSIRLRGRPDDLEYIPIYVENAVQITACAAECAAPILLDEVLFGILLCGSGAMQKERGSMLPVLLDVICEHYSLQAHALFQGERHSDLR
jgi:hypothetical protein